MKAEPILIRFTIVNVGETDATEIEWRTGHVTCAPRFNMYNIDDIQDARSANLTALGSGLDHVVDYESPTFIPAIIIDPILRGTEKLLSCGVIAYSDGSGNVRRTGFFRRFNPEALRFDVEPDYDDEYQN